MGSRLLIAARSGVDVRTWREAVRAAADLLVEIGAAEPAYVDACVESVEKNGPYIVLTRGLALAHARPEDGALGVGLTVVRLAHPLDFLGAPNGPVDVVLGLCTPDAHAHLDVMRALARGLSGGLADRMRSAPDTAHLEELLKEVVPDGSENVGA